MPGRWRVRATVEEMEARASFAAVLGDPGFRAALELQQEVQQEATATDDEPPAAAAVPAAAAPAAAADFPTMEWERPLPLTPGAATAAAPAPSPREAPTTAAKEAALARARAAKAARGKAAGAAKVKVPLGDVTNGAAARCAQPNPTRSPIA